MSALFAYIGLLEGEDEVHDARYRRQFAHLATGVSKGGQFRNVEPIHYPGFLKDHRITGFAVYTDLYGGRSFTKGLLTDAVFCLGANDDIIRSPRWKFWKKPVVIARGADSLEFAHDQLAITLVVTP